MSEHGVGKSVVRKEDERFLRGRGQYVADFRIPGAREIAFVRSPVAHGRMRDVHIPDAHKHAVFTAKDLANVRPIQAATALSGFKHSQEHVLARDKVRYVGELVAACVATSRAEAEDIAATVVVDYEELPSRSSTCSLPGAPTRRWCRKNGAITSSSSSFRKERSRRRRSHRRDRADYGHA